MVKPEGMKLRCVENSIRLRLRKSDIEELRKRQKVEESVAFGPQETFRFALMILPGPAVKASFSQGRMLISIPEDLARHWMETDQIGLEAEQTYPGGNTLHILIEKDFPCLDRPEEDKSDTFQELAEKKDSASC